MAEIVGDSQPLDPEPQPLTPAAKRSLKTGLATAAAVGVGAALIEIEWVPGLLLGVAAMAAPNLVPSLGRGIRPFVRSAVKAGYAATRKTREWVAEAGEQMSDMMAEVRSASLEAEANGTHAHSNGSSPNGASREEAHAQSVPADAQVSTPPAGV